MSERHWFLSPADAVREIGAWREYYSEARPHSALEWSTPAEYAHRAPLAANR